MSVQSEIDRINGAKSTLAANIESEGFTAGEGASIVQLASTVGDAFTDTSSRLATVNGASGTINTQLDTLDSTKAAIKDAIVSKGVEIPEETTFYEYAGLIDGIESGGGVEIHKGKADVVDDGKFGTYSFAIPLSTGKSIIVQVYEEEEPSLHRCVFASSLSDGSLGSSPPLGALTIDISITENFATVEGYTSMSNVNYHCIVF